MAKLDIKKIESKQSYFTGRNLSEKNKNLIVDEIASSIDHNLIKQQKNADEKWSLLKNKLITITVQLQNRAYEKHND